MTACADRSPQQCACIRAHLRARPGVRADAHAGARAIVALAPDPFVVTLGSARLVGAVARALFYPSEATQERMAPYLRAFAGSYVVGVQVRARPHTVAAVCVCVCVRACVCVCVCVCV